MAKRRRQFIPLLGGGFLAALASFVFVYGIATETITKTQIASAVLLWLLGGVGMAIGRGRPSPTLARGDRRVSRDATIAERDGR